MQTVKCTLADVDILAEMNRQLIEDEKSDNAMSLGELKERMLGFPETKYTAYIFKENSKTVGYALVDISVKPYYLRQFFISKAHRGRHMGQTAFGLLLKELNTNEIDVEVLSHNEAGLAFWGRLGFKERSRYLRLNKENNYGIHNN